MVIIDADRAFLTKSLVSKNWVSAKKPGYPALSYSPMTASLCLEHTVGKLHDLCVGWWDTKCNLGQYPLGEMLFLF